MLRKSQNIDKAEQTIQSMKESYGKELSILAHHYQNDTIVTHADLTGDSLELARHIPGLDSTHIVFCGVHFMAESAAILAQKNQKIYIPRLSASCVMADMAPGVLCKNILETLHGSGLQTIPLAYVNSSAAIKALCGEYGGSVCTSANAKTMMEWALSRGDQVLFLPDKNLGMNTADQLHLPDEGRHILDIRQKGAHIDPQGLRRHKLLLWPGVCAVHFRFKPRHVRAALEQHPGAKIIVHPECSPDVVKMSHGVGSTSYIIEYVDKAPEGEILYIGTETNLVQRLAEKYKNRKSIYPLEVSACSNMAKITKENLAALLGDLQGAKPVTVPSSIQKPAFIALQRMLDVCS